MENKGRNTHFYRKSLFQVFAMLIALSACEQPQTFVPGYTDRFTNYVEDNYAQADKLLQADYIFVLDYSYSMSGGNKSSSTILSQLYDSMDEFTGILESENTDYNIGFVKGNSHANSASTISSDFVAPFLTLSSNSSGLDSQIMSQIASVGDDLQQNTNYLLESALRVSKNQKDVFLRGGSQLVYVFFTDSEDLSDKNSRISGSRSTSYYTTELKKFRSNSAYISARSFTAGNAAGCSTHTSWEVEAPRIRAVAQGIDSLGAGGQCVYDNMATSLSNLARDVTKTTKRFLLRGKPAPGSVHVYVDGSEVAAAGNWSFLSSSNEVVFVDGLEPAPSSQVRFEYEMRYPLAKKPKVDTITVTVNGTTVSQSASDGWTYVDGEQRIEFHGSGVPAHNADIRVNYVAK